MESNRTTTTFWIVAAAGLAWNAFGVVQYLASVKATEASLIASGMTAEQAAVMLNHPAWMTAAFAIGVFGGTLGSVLMLMRKKFAVPVFAVSLAAYVALYAGDITEGVFAALGLPQVAILTLVVAIAAVLLVYSRAQAKRGVID
jgi:hypothetical protein